MNTNRTLRTAVAAIAATAAGVVVVSGSTVLAVADDAVSSGESGVSTSIVIGGIAAGVALLGLVIARLVDRSARDFELPEQASLSGIVAASSRRHRPAPEQLDRASRDRQTGLANRRRLDHDLMAHAERRGITAVMMIDVDQYDEVEAQFGTPAADDLVREIGEALSSNVRFDDVVYRYGHKEFCILLPEATLAEGHLVAARLILVVHGLSLRNGDQATVSIGISGTSDGRVNQALSGADLALLEAKKSGRDQASMLSLT